MARRKDLMDIREILAHIRAGSSNRQIERDLKIDRRTVRRYREWAEGQGLLTGELPELERLQELLESTLPEKRPPQNISTVEPYREVVEKLVKEKVEAKAIYHRLEERGFKGSYSAVYRFVRGVRGQKLDATVRVERPPGEEGQVDFGYAGKMIDPETGK
jgi:transposase